MMKAAVITFLAAFAAVDASTKIAVLEFGNGGTVRRAQAKSAETTVEGVISFWSTLHRRTSSNIQHAGMTVVPDLFRQPDSGVVVVVSGSGVDLDSLPGFASVFEIEETVGWIEVPGGRSQSLLDTVLEVTEASAETLAKSVIDQANMNGLNGVKVVVDQESVSVVDQQLLSVVAELKNAAQVSKKSIVVHFVVEEDESVSRRRRLSRRLDEQDANGENVADDKEYNGYYGYAYMNKYGVWVTPYKTMFQIQYFNVVTWTAIGLVLILIYGVYLMAFMPLEPDTLLFGESAKFVGDE
jgi:hypothetical protein